MARNKNLNTAKKKKDDEFYTKLKDIQNELSHQDYQDFLKDKVVYCNCDSEKSKFVEYFKDLKAKGIIKDLWYTSSDYALPENIEKLKKADVIITNPPFSLMRDYIATLFKYEKKFLILGPCNMVTYKEVFPLIMDRKLWFGWSFGRGLSFDRPDGSEKSVKCVWATNIMIHKDEKFILTKKFDGKLYPKYDNYDAYNVDRLKDIPYDFEGVLGCPITILKYLNPETGCIEVYVEEESDINGSI